MFTYSKWIVLRRASKTICYFHRSLTNSVEPHHSEDPRRSLSELKSGSSHVSIHHSDSCVEPVKKLLKVAIIGNPNSGKSTLINQVVKRRVFPISQKVHTTRCRARAISVEENTQLVFLDTPGLVTVSESEKYKLGPEFVSGGEHAINEADLIGVVHDLSNGYTRAHLDPKVLRLLHLFQSKESFLVLNKIDTLKSKRYLLDLATIITGGSLKGGNNKSGKKSPMSEKVVAEVIKRKSYWENFSRVFMVSAILGKGIDDIRNYLLSEAQPGEWMFPPDSFTDRSKLEIVEETVRAKLLEYLPNEVPYHVTVQLEFMDFSDGRLSVVVLVYCKSDRHMKVVLGLSGERIKTIESEAEQDLCDTFLCDVYLKVVVQKT